MAVFPRYLTFKIYLLICIIFLNTPSFRNMIQLSFIFIFIMHEYYFVHFKMFNMFIKNLFFVFVLLSTIIVDKNFITNKIDLCKNENFMSLNLKKIILELRGGGKKRKKKNFTKPKKNKHIKKKVTLRYLNYYSVTEGKAQKIKKTSPESPGCFMAEHIDRLTCGKSGLTFTRA